MKIAKNIANLLKSCRVIEKNKGDFTLYQYVSELNSVLFAFIQENGGSRSTLIYNDSLPFSMEIRDDNFKKNQNEIKETFAKVTGFEVDGVTSSPDDFGQMKHFLQLTF